jgi:hypothetical protein
MLQDSLDESDSEDLGDFILEDSDQVIVYHINDTISDNCPHTDVSFGNVVIKCILDTGAQVTIMSERVYDKLIVAGVTTLELAVQNVLLLNAFGSKMKRIKRQAGTFRI